jgi:hypothetical protein
MARYTVCLKEHRDNIDYNRLKADAQKLQVADPSLSFDAAIAKATENVIAELKAQEAEIMALLGEEPVAEPERVEAAPKSAEPVAEVQEQPAPPKEAERTVEPEAKSEVQKAEPVKTESAGGESVEHSGYHIYQISVKGEPYFAVQSEDNKAKGLKRGFGDSLLPTLEAAKKEAELQARRAEEAKRWEAEAEQESAREEAAKAERIDMDGFGDDLNPLAKGRLATALGKQVRLKGKADTVKNHVRALVSDGAKTESYEEDRIKPMSRMAFFRADAKTQEEHEKRVREGGKKTVYLVEGFDLGKVAYDYANFLIAKKADTTLQKDAPDKQRGMKPEALVAMLPGYAKRMMKDGKLVVVKDAAEAQAYSGQRIPDTSQGFYYPRQDRVVLIANMASSKENLMMVLNHELLHRAEFVDPDVKATMKRLDDQFFERFKLAKLGKATPAEREAYRRIAYSTSPKEFHMLEFRAYLVSEYNKDPNSLAGYIKKLVQDFIAAIRVALMRAGVSLKELTAADMNRIAETYGAQAYRRGEGEVTLFSNTAVDELWQELNTQPSTYLNDFKIKSKKGLGKAIETKDDLFYAALTQNQLVDLLEEILPEGRQFAKERNNYDVEESNWHNRADEIAKRWENIVEADHLIRSEKNRQQLRLEQAKIADWMHESTTSGIDARLPRPKDTGKNGIELHKYDQLKAKWDRLSADSRKLINDVDKFHQDVTARLLDTLIDKVEQAEMPKETKAKIIKGIKDKFNKVQGPYFPLMRTGDYWIDHADGVEMFETEIEWKAAKKALKEKGTPVYGSGKSLKNFNRVEGVDANFLESVNDLIDTVTDEDQANALKDGVFQLYLQALPENSMRKRMIHRKNTPGWEKDALRSFSRKAFHDGKQLAKLRFAPAMRRVLTDISNTVRYAESDKRYAMLKDRIQNIRDAIALFEQGMDFDTIAAKFNDDTEALRPIRRFSRFKDEIDRDQAMTEYLKQQEALLEDVDKFRGLDFENKETRAANLLKALNKSYENMMKPSGNAASHFINQTVFTWMLGFNPGSALINLSQVPFVSAPVMAGRHNFQATNRAFWKAYKDFIGGKEPNGDDMGIYSKLDDNERKMYEALTENGLFDRTRAHDLAGFGDEGVARGTLIRTFMGWSTYLFHKAEVMNREVTALMAFRLEYKKTGSLRQAIDYADRIVRDTHFDYCVDTETECLTLSGWKKFNELTSDDVCVAVDPDGKAVESKVLAVNIFKGQKDVIAFDGSPRRFSMVVTPNHRCVVQNYNSRDKKWQRVKFVEAQDLKQSHFILRTPLAPVDREGGKYGVDFAALLGWIAAEGWYTAFRNCKDKNCVWLSQSGVHNPEYVSEIRALISRLGGHASEYAPAKNGVISWTFRKPIWSRVIDVMPDKVLTFDMVRDMNADEMRAVIDAFSKGDGRHRAGTWTIGQKNNGNTQNLEVLQAMAALCAKPATRLKESNGSNFLNLHGGNVKGFKRTMAKTVKRSDRVVDTVWCPTTEHGTWIARRNGAMFVTGNSAANRPDLFQGNFRRVAFQFKMYSQGVTYLWGKTFRDAFITQLKTPEQKAEAKRIFYAMVGTQMIAAGAMGLPIGGILMGAQMAASAFDDDDEPIDVEVGIRKALTYVFGDTIGKIIAKGPLSAATGLDFHSRLSLSDLWIREPDKELEGKDTAYYLLKTAFGPAGGLLEDVFVGGKLWGEGNKERAVEKWLPHAVSSLVKSGRMIEEGGAAALSGEMIYEMNALEKAFQAAGIRSLGLSEQQEQNAAFKNRETAVGDTKLKLLHAAVNARLKGDNDAYKEAMSDIKEFNAKYPKLRITPASIMKSIKTRKKNKANTREGLVVKPKYEFIRDEENFL